MHNSVSSVLSCAAGKVDLSFHSLPVVVVGFFMRDRVEGVAFEAGREKLEVCIDLTEDSETRFPTTRRFLRVSDMYRHLRIDMA